MRIRFSTVVLSVVFFLFCPLSFSQECSPVVFLSLDSCLDMARENSAALKNARLDVLAAKAQRQEALARYFPEVSVSAFAFGALDPMLEIGIVDVLGNNTFSRNLEYLLRQMSAELGVKTRYTGLEKGLMASVSAMQPLYAGGRIVNGNRLASLGVEASSLQERIRNRETAEEVEKNYWLVVSLEEKGKTLLQLQELLDNVEKDVNSAYRAGLATETDVMQVKLKQNELKSGKIQVENGIRLAKMNLFNTVGFRYNPYRNVDMDSLPRLDQVLLSDTLGGMLPPETYYKEEEGVAAAQEEMRLLDLQVDAGKLMKKMTLGEALPEIGIGASYGYNDLLRDGGFNGAVYVMAKIPISDWGGNVRKMQRYGYQLQKAENDRDFYGEQILLQIRQLWLNLTTAWDQMVLAQESVETARRTADQLSEHYRAGMSSLSELLQAQALLRQASETFVEQKIAYRTALRSYLYRVGNPMDKDR